jgi:hypothetical protein
VLETGIGTGIIICAAELHIESVENMDTAHIFKFVLAGSN